MQDKDKVHLALDGILQWKRKQFMAEHLRNGGVRLNEYAPAVTFSVLIYANALKWVVKVVKGGVNALMGPSNQVHPIFGTKVRLLSQYRR
ncbi:hypothetical protein Scep_005002 [Stephania cephalantha]|uniref:Uncharacterized protein n=1 Tax=Stephania cephalantha TaxID=152367 RepID=A0AAP0KTH3_9MAGN